MYEEGTVGFETTINFNTPMSGKESTNFVVATPMPELSSDSEPDSEGFMTDEGEERHGRPIRA